MIPKKIHYCWFGKAPYPKSVKDCINSWKKYCPDYEIIEWNESNVNLYENIYIEQAYNEKKWAFVSDYARVKGLYEMGGIYLDTDMEVIGKLDSYLSLDAFAGFEADDRIQTGLLACEKGHSLFKEFLEGFSKRTFIKENGSLDLTTNVKTITDICVKYGLEINGEKQTIAKLTVFPRDYFCPKDNLTYKLELTENSVTIHHFHNSWMSKKQKLIKKMHFLFGSNLLKWGVIVKRFIKKLYNIKK